jgi:hypothetical protein
VLETTGYLEVVNSNVNSNAAVSAAARAAAVLLAATLLGAKVERFSGMRLIKRNLLSYWGSLFELPHPVSAARLPPYYRGP